MLRIAILPARVCLSGGRIPLKRGDSHACGIRIRETEVLGEHL